MNWPPETIYPTRLRYWYRNIIANRLFLFFTSMTRNLISFCFLLCAIALFSACQKEYSIETGKTTVDAIGSLKDSAGNCMPDSVVGTFYNGVTPGSDTAYVEVKVRVDSVGSYTITTDLQNGFMFADSGFFNTTGINIVRLKPIGTPILQKPTLFTVSFDTSICSFTVNVQDSTGTGLGGGDTTGTGGVDTSFGWQFTATGDTTYSAKYQDTSKAFIYDTTASGLAVKYITMNWINEFGDSLFQISLINTGGPVTATYNTNVVLPNGALVLYTDNDKTYGSDPVTFVGSNIVIVVTTYNTTTKIIEGTFSGTAITDSGGTINITNGTFKSRLP